MGAGSGPSSDSKLLLSKSLCRPKSPSHIFLVFQATGTDSSILAQCQWNDTAGTAIEVVKAPEEPSRDISEAVHITDSKQDGSETYQPDQSDSR